MPTQFYNSWAKQEILTRVKNYLELNADISIKTCRMK